MSLKLPRPPAPRPISQRPWSRIIRITRPLFTSEVRWYVIAWLVALVALVLGVVGLNVVNGYVINKFMTAISERNSAAYRTEAIRYLMVFAASTAVAVFAKFAEERLGILWRGWLTGHLIDKYLMNRAYHRLMGRNDIDNPDQRMTEDVKTFTTTTLSFSSCSSTPSLPPPPSLASHLADLSQPARRRNGLRLPGLAPDGDRRP